MAETRRVSNSVYTVLVFVALAFLLGGVIYLMMRSNELFGTWNPLDAKPLSMVLPEFMLG
ncbi:MAG: hypothetical protein AAGC44_05850 [Planctomycetota bacterium]